MNKIPVLVLAFNRAYHVEQAMREIREYKPERLYLECDGARPYKKGEAEAVDATRKMMTDMVDWQCEVKTLFREKNFGCANSVKGAIDWFFENEEYGIIIEDDIVVSQDFFKLCEDLLPRYQDNDKILEISARNHSFRKDINDTYVYAQCYHCWGWATWRRAWKHMDMSMSSVYRLPLRYYVMRLGWVRGLMMRHYFKVAVKKLATFNSWATRWYLTILDKDALVICPGVNLAINIGIDGGTHYEAGDEDPYAGLSIGKVEWPLKYNDHFVPDKIQTKCDNADFLNVRIIGLKKKIRRMFKK